MDRFETYNKHRDFKAFHYEQAVAFKHYLAKEKNQRTGEPLSKATLHATLLDLRKFFEWIYGQPGFKSRFSYSDASYFNLSLKDTRIATAKREQRSPILEQVKHVIHTMPASTDIERRNRALIAFTLMTAARVRALASAKIKHIDLSAGVFMQDSKEVKTKFSKSFPTYFFPVGDEIVQIVIDWITYLKEEMLWGNDDPLFPSTEMGVGNSSRFEVIGLKREHWSSTTPIRTIFREAFVSAGLPYFNPHSFRNTLVQLGQNVCKSPEEFKAWSQNLGHEKVLTTFHSYGEVAYQRQGEIIRGLATPQQAVQSRANEITEAVFKNFAILAWDMQVK